jgi:two-component system response regulator AlgR
MKVLIVDDEAPARTRLRRLLDDLGEHEVVGEAADGAEAVRAAAGLQPDLVLLDVRMPGMDGLEAARHIAGTDPPPALVFTTAYGDHALEAFESHAVDYLLKPVRGERLRQAIAGARRRTRAQLEDATGEQAPRAQICARLGGEMELVPIGDVLYFQAEHKYVTVRHRGGEVLIEESLKALEREFGDRFLRIHRNALVAEAWVGGLRRNRNGRQSVWFKEVDETLEVSRRHLPAVRKRLRSGNLTPP